MAGADYFNIFFPYPEVNPGQRFFFFNSLNDGSAPWEKGLLAKQVNDILNQNQEYFKQSDDEESITIIDQALDFLKKMAIERATAEKQYFLEHLNEKDIGKQLSDELKSCYSDEKVDYLNFMKIINEYYKKGEEFQVILDKEVDRLRRLEAAYDAYRAANAKKEKKSSTEQTQENIDDERILLRNVISWYYKKGDEESKKIARELQANSSLMINSLTSLIQRTWNIIMESNQIKNFLKEKITSDTNLQDVQAEIVTYITLEFFNNNILKIYEYLKKTDHWNKRGVRIEETIANQMADEIINSLELSNGEKVYFDMTEKQILQILEDVRAISQDSNYLSDLRGRFLKQLGFIELTKQKEIPELSGELEKFLLEQLKDIKVATMTTDKEGKRKKRNNRDIILDKLKILIKRSNPLNQVIQAGEIDNEMIRDRINALIKENSRAQFKPGKGMPSESTTRTEMIRGALNSIKTSGFGLGSQKDDIVTLELGSYIFETYPSKIAEGIAKIVTDNFLQSLREKDIPITFKDSSGRIVKNYIESAVRDEKGFKSNEFFLEGETNRRIAALQKTFTSIQESLTNIQNLKDRQQEALKIMKSMFTTEGSVKGYDTYDTKMGFHGGSIGGTVEHQIENIMKMFEYGGITLPDANWLIFAVYNAGPNLLGYKNKSSLEDLFSTVAVMMLFDDAGVQAQYITQQAEQYLVPITSGIHLYNLQSTYVPESLVLKLTYNGLLKSKKVIFEDVQQFSSKGSRANIINNVDPTSGIKKGLSQTGQEAWNSFFTTNKSKVSINITFLAGFLDILQQLREMMSDSPLTA